MRFKEDGNAVIAMVGGGKTIHFDNIVEMSSITCDETEPHKPIPPLRFDPQKEITFTLKPQRVSRKRFVSNMRKIGYPKKLAKRIAWATKMPYSTAWMLVSLGAIDENGKVDRRRFNNGQDRSE